MFNEKKIIRDHVKLLKRNITAKEKELQSLYIFDQIEKMDVFHRAHIVLCYWSLSDEVDTHGFIKKWVQKKFFLLPVVDENELKLKLFTGEDNLIKTTQFNIFEPAGEDFTSMNEIDLAIIPGIAFDKNKNRMGRGKGYYDRFLPKIRAIKTGVCFNFQLFDEVPHNEKDIKMDIVVSGNSIIS